MTTLLTNAELIAEIRKRYPIASYPGEDGYRSVAEVARCLGMNEQYFGQMLLGKQNISWTLAEKLGYRRVVMFEPIREETTP